MRKNRFGRRLAAALFATAFGVLGFTAGHHTTSSSASNQEADAPSYGMSFDVQNAEAGQCPDGRVDCKGQCCLAGQSCYTTGCGAAQPIVVDPK